MLIDLSNVFHQEGKEKSWEVPFECRAYRQAGEEYPVVSSAPIKITVKNLGERKLALSGSTEVTLSIPCARCLEPVDLPSKLTFDQELDMRAGEEASGEMLDEQPFLSGYTLDADQLVCNELALSLPMKVLCKEDCKGICNRCGANLNHGICGCDTRSQDPRMAVIQEIFKQFKEV